MEHDDIGLKGSGDDTGTLIGYAGISSGPGKSSRIGNIVPEYALRKSHHIIEGYVGLHLGEAGHHDIVEVGIVHGLGLFKAGLDDLLLPLGTGKIAVHQTQPRIGHRLYAVQMMYSG